MRAVLLVVLLAGFGPGCGASHANSPAWPKMADKDADGGESLTPRPGANAVAAIEGSSDDPDDDDDIKVVAPAPATQDAAAPAKDTGTPAKDAADDPLQVDDIVIEIDD